MSVLPPMIHIPHGAGDRAKSYDPRIRHFDNVLVAGEKDKARMMELGLVSDENCKVTGYIKPYAVKQMAYDLPVLFKTKRPTVLYNPHFAETFLHGSLLDSNCWNPFPVQLILISFLRPICVYSPMLVICYAITLSLIQNLKMYI